MTEEEMPKLTPEQLIAIVDEASSDFEAAFVPAYLNSARKSLAAFKRAIDEGMAEDIVVVTFIRFCWQVDMVTGRMNDELDKLRNEYGLRKECGL